MLRPPLRDVISRMRSFMAFSALGGDAAFDHSSGGDPETEAQELAIPHARDGTLVGVDLQSELGVETDQRLHDPLARPLRLHIHIAVIRIACETMPASLQLLVDLVQEHVRQERREWPTLRRALVPFLHDPIRQDPRVEIPANQCQESTIRDAPIQLPHEHIVIDAIKELRQIDIDHPAATALHGLLRRTHRIVRPTPRPEAVAGL